MDGQESVCDRELDGVDVTEFLANAMRRYDEMMEMAVRASENADVNRYLLHPLSAFVSSPGKRVRPALCELACLLVGGDASDARGVAAALECFHAAALIHDDIEDGSLIRRGRPAYHVAEGTPLAVNAGDYGLAMAFSLVFDDAGLSNDVRLRVLSELTAMAKRTIEGQAVDIGWARDGRFDVSVSDYLFVAAGKSAYYSCAAPLALGAIVGGGSEDRVEVLREVGMKAGIAFQIRDDLLNLQGDCVFLGKGVLTDIAEGKRTVIVAHALEASPRARELGELLSLPDKSHSQVEVILDILRGSGSMRFANTVVDRLCEEALDLVAGAFPPSRERIALEQMIAFLGRREL